MEKSLLALLQHWLIGHLTVHVWLTVAQSAISSWALWLDSSRVQYDAKCADSQLSPSVFLHVTSAASVPFRTVYSWFITRTKPFFTSPLSCVELWIDVNPVASSVRLEEYFESAHRHTLLVKLLSQETYGSIRLLPESLKFEKLISMDAQSTSHSNTMPRVSPTWVMSPLTCR